MLTAVQQILLTCLLGPEDKTAFKRSQTAAAARERRRALTPEDAALRKAQRSAKRSEDPERWRQKERERYAKDVERSRGRAREWFSRDPEGMRRKRQALRQRDLEAARKRERKIARALRAKDPEKFREKARASQKTRRGEDIGFRLLGNLRGRLSAALRGKDKSAHTEELLGCTPGEWRVYLEKQFRPGMTWKNYGTLWNVDHIRPCASFDLTDPVQQRACFNYTNTQPLGVIENIQKGDKWPG